MFFTDDRCGYCAKSNTSTSSSLMLRYWSTDFRIPRMRMSFLSSMVTVWLVRVLKKLQKAQCQHRLWTLTSAMGSSFT